MSLMFKPLIYTCLFLFLVAFSFCASAADKEVVATVYGKAIYRDDVQGKNKNLEMLLILPLYKRFAADNHIVATEAEIDEVSKAMAGVSPSATLPEQRAIMHDISRNCVLNWKISKALYNKYGGDVIFQQANPLEPIEAERRFLEEQEKSGAFQIMDTKERTKFFAYYIQLRHPIPPSRVNYDMPWWKEAMPKQ